MLANTSDGHIRITSIIVALIFYFVNYFVRKMSNIKKISPLDNEFLRCTTVIDKPASCLWYMGKIPVVQPTVAVVGSRKPTSYGQAVSQQIVSELARHSVIIVSGLAIGHDSIAHKTCLEAGGTTVAVIGNGLNDIHPHSNQQLATEIINNDGAIISEYPPDEPVYPSHFLERNRLISALADIVVIIEAGERSGTLNTASHALSQGKDVMAVPGNITSPLSRGCNRLIAQGATELPITDAAMTRFWITLDQGVNFVLQNLVRMRGGETFVPKIPSIKITDLATALAPNLPQKIIGIRPGEKIHEVMCPRDDFLHTLEFDKFFIIKPAITYTNSHTNKFDVTPLGEEGRQVAEGFEYNSLNNPHYLTVDELIEINKHI